MLGAVFAQALPTAALDWQAGREAEAWRWWSAAFVHWSPWHLALNLVATAVVMAYGWAARVPAAAALAWALAWPLTQGGLVWLAPALAPELAHYGGLSGVLHAGIAVVTLWLLVRSRGAVRALGGVIAALLGTKLVAEVAFGGPASFVPALGAAVAPAAHLSGALAGLLAAAAVLAWPLLRR